MQENLVSGWNVLPIIGHNIELDLQDFYVKLAYSIKYEKFNKLDF